MNNCKQCAVEACLHSETEGVGCKAFKLRDLTEFEKTLTRRGLICGFILGFLFAISITWPLWGIWRIFS